MLFNNIASVTWGFVIKHKKEFFWTVVVSLVVGISNSVISLAIEYGWFIPNQKIESSGDSIKKPSESITPHKTNKEVVHSDTLNRNKIK